MPVSTGIVAARSSRRHDAETAVLMREHGIRRICTRDTDFHRFSFIEVVDPLVADPQGMSIWWMSLAHDPRRCDGGPLEGRQ